MAYVECDIEEALVEGPGAKAVNGLVATCSRCDHCVELKGYDTRGNREMAAKLLRETCPAQERNVYTFPVDEHEDVQMETTEA